MINATTIVVLELEVVVLLGLLPPRLLLRIRRLSPALVAGWGAPLPLLRPFVPLLAGIVRSKCQEARGANEAKQGGRKCGNPETKWRAQQQQLRRNSAAERGYFSSGLRLLISHR